MQRLVSLASFGMFILTAKQTGRFVEASQPACSIGTKIATRPPSLASAPSCPQVDQLTHGNSYSRKLTAANSVLEDMSRRQPTSFCGIAGPYWVLRSGNPGGKCVQFPSGSIVGDACSKGPKVLVKNIYSSTPFGCTFERGQKSAL